MKIQAKPAEEQTDVKVTSEEQTPKSVEKLPVKPAEEQADVQVNGDEQNAKGVPEDVNGLEMEQVSLADGK